MNKKSCRLLSETSLTGYFSKWDYLCIAVITVFAFFSIAHFDLYLTGNRSWLLYSHNILSFYDASFEWVGNDGANYMPTIFWLYGIWNLPLRLFKAFPETVMNNSLLCTMWYKLLTTFLYSASTVLISKIARKIGLSAKTSTICAVAFFTCPVAFYPQFIISQYDIFTVFFMLLGIWYYLKKDTFKFLIFFGISFTCKYFSLPIFFILLLLSEKRVLEIFKKCFVAAIPILLELALYYRSEGFRRGVFGFGVLDVVANNGYSSFYGTLNIAYAVGIVIVASAYFISPTSDKNLFEWFLYLSSGICFVFFGLMSYNPQWILFAAPFWVLGHFISKHHATFLWMDTIGILLFYIMVCNYLPGGVDEHMLEGGIWKYFIEVSDFTVHMNGLFASLDRNIVFTLFFAIVLLYFIFQHPKYNYEDYSEIDGALPSVWLYRLRFLVCTVGYFVLVLLTVQKNLFV